MRASLCLGYAFLIASTFATNAVGQERVVNLPVGRDNEESLLTRPANLEIRDVLLGDALEALARASGVRLAYSPSSLPPRHATCACRDVDVEEALGRILWGSHFGFFEADQQVVITPPLGRTLSIPSPRVVPGESMKARFAVGYDGGIRVPSVAQQVGVVGGTIVDATSGAALSGAQVSQQGTERGTLSDASGTFRLQVTGGGEVTLQVVLIGYHTLTLQVRVGQTDLHIAMDQSAVELDALVVTGTAGDQRKRAIGNAVGKVDVGQLQDMAPQPDMSQMLNSSTPGVVINPGGGEVGAGGNIRVRGLSSPSLPNAPLVYVDGVRVEGEDANPRFFYVGSLWNTSRLNDLDPSEIESIEVLKGPAAATLYGTEASNGVINIITKRGTQGQTKINMTVEEGANWLQNPESTFPSAYYKDASGNVQTFSVVQNESARGTPFFRTGRRGRYALEASGGSGDLRFFSSLGYETDQSPFRINDLKRFNSRLNIDAVVTPKLHLSAGAGYVKSTIHPGGNANGTPLACAFYPDPSLADTPSRGCTGGPPEVYAEAWQRTQDVNRFTADIRATYEPWSWLTNRLTAGTDFVDQVDVGLVERLPEDIAQYFGHTAEGRKDEQRATVTNRTFDLSSTATFPVSSSLSSSTSVGLQIYQRVTQVLNAHAEDFPAVGIQSVSSAALTSTGEQYVKNVTVGTYVQEQVAWKDRLFLTGAIRADDNSAFGRNFDLVTYPKVSGAWVISEEPFWHLDMVNTLRLRAAYGQAGHQPDAFSALQTFEPFVGPNDVATVRPQFAGNPDLGPERGEETEVGFEAGLFHDRLSFDFTYYSKHTKDAILSRNTAPSLGFPQTQFVNVGEVSNSGIELLTKGTILQRPDLNWDVSLNLATNKNELTSLGGLPPIAQNIRLRLEEGYPIGSWFEKRVVHAEVTPDGTDVTNILCDPGDGGSPIPCDQAPRVYLGDDTPNLTGSVTNVVTLFGRLTLYAMFDFKRGYRIDNFARIVACTNDRRCRENVDPSYNPIWAAEEKLHIWGNSIFQDASFVKFRQLSATYRMPTSWAERFGASAASVTVSGRNLHTWSSWWTGDPEVQDILTGVNLLNLQQGDLPHPTQFTASINVTF